MDAGTARASARKPRVLIVDDEPELLAIFSQACRGYEVATAADGLSALRQVAQRCPDVLVSDLVLGAMDGEELVRRCLRICPRLHVIFVSGFGADELRAAGITQVVYLQKPVTPQTLRETVDSILAR
jgi:two-component system, response regulator YesN